MLDDVMCTIFARRFMDQAHDAGYTGNEKREMRGSATIAATFASTGGLTDEHVNRSAANLRVFPPAARASAGANILQRCLRPLAGPLSGRHFHALTIEEFANGRT